MWGHVSPTAKVLQKLSHATGQWSQPQQKTYNRMAQIEKNQGFSMTQWKSRLQSDWNDVVGERCARNECNTQWNKATLPRRVGQISSTMMMRDWESHNEKDYFKVLLLKWLYRLLDHEVDLFTRLHGVCLKKVSNNCMFWPIWQNNGGGL